MTAQTANVVILILFIEFSRTESDAISFDRYRIAALLLTQIADRASLIAQKAKNH